MSTNAVPKFSPGEAVTETDGLIHGVSAQELQVLGEQAFDARGRAYCKSSPTEPWMNSGYGAWERNQQDRIVG